MVLGRNSLSGVPLLNVDGQDLATYKRVEQFWGLIICVSVQFLTFVAVNCALRGLLMGSIWMELLYS